jgi:3',5'-cyclic AMP phosphodiesterase CpdA
MLILFKPEYMDERSKVRGHVMRTKKRFLILVFILLILGLAGCKSSNSIKKVKSGKDITFFVSTDIHYLAESLTDNGEAFQKFISDSDGRQLNYISEIIDAFVSDIKKKKPEVLIVSGDLTTNGEKDSHLELAEKFKKIEESGTSVFVIPGNHDILNPFARGFKDSNQYLAEYITEKDFEKIYKDYGYSEAVSRDNNTLSYLAAPSEDVWLLILDTVQYKDNVSENRPRLDGEINPGTLEWIKECSILAKKNNAQIIAVMHHNLIDHSDIIKEGYTINNSKAALQIFETIGIKLALTGHTHLQDIKSYSKGEYKVYDVVTSALGIYPQQYGVLKYSPQNGYDYSTSSVDVESWSREEGLTDENLNNFKLYSEEYFKNNAYNMTFRRLLMDDSYTIEEVKLMAETSALVRTKHFGGTTKLNKQEIINSQGYKLLSESGAQRSLMRMLDSDNSVNKNLEIPLKE